MTTKNTNTEIAVVDVNTTSQSIALQSQSDLSLAQILESGFFKFYCYGFFL